MSMLNKTISIIAAFLIAGSYAFPQRITFRVEPGFGTFNMQDLKDFQKFTIPDLGVEIESLTKFPHFTGYGVAFVYHLNSEIGVGICTDFFSTGARNYYEDYSGLYSMDILAHSYNIGTVFSISNFEGKKMNFCFEIQQGLKSSQVELSENLTINKPIVSETYNLNSTSWWIKPGMRIEHNIFQFLSAGVFLGGELNIKSKLHINELSNAVLRNKNGEEITINWSGLRATLSLSVNIGKKKQVYTPPDLPYIN